VLDLLTMLFAHRILRTLVVPLQVPGVLLALLGIQIILLGIRRVVVGASRPSD
jgi:hypothetical protein